MNNIDYSNPNLLDHVYKNLNPSDILDNGKLTVFQRISVYLRRLITAICRIAYKIFKGGVWHNESEAHRILRDYMNNVEVKEKLSPQHKKIMLIYDRLAHLSREQGT